jgi:translocation and assembly module TamB
VSNTKKILTKIFKILGIVLGVILILVVALILFIRSPWGQGIIVDKATTYLEEKTGADVNVGRLFVTFSGNIFLEDFYICDLERDTLVYSRRLEAGVAIAPLLTSGNINVTKLDWEGLVARVDRKEATGKFNFDFLLEAFASDNTQTSASDTIASDPISIKIAPVSLRDFDLVYQDEVLGIDAKILLGELAVDIPKIDLEKYVFKIDQVALTNTQARYHQTKPFPPSEEEESATPLPRLQLDELLLSNLNLDYQSEPDQMEVLAKIGRFLVELPEANLHDQVIRLDKVELLSSSLSYADFSEKLETAAETVADTVTFTWPEWTVAAKQISIDSTDLEYKTRDIEVSKGRFNPEAIAISGLKLDAGDISLEDQKASASLREFQFVEGSGFEFNQFQFDLKLDPKAIDISDLAIQTNRSQLSADASLTYLSIDDFLAFPEKSSVKLLVEDTQIDVRDAFFFSPELAQDTLIREIARAPIQLDMELDGDMKQINLENLLFQWSKTTLAAKGAIREALDTDKLHVDLPSIRAFSTRSDLVRFVDEKSLGIQLPDTLALISSVKGSMDDLLASMDLQTNLGNIVLDASYQNQQTLAFDAELGVAELQLGKLLRMPELDTATFQIKAVGSGTDIYSMTAELSSSFEKLGLYNGDYSGLQLEGKLVEGAGDVRMWIKEEFLDFDLRTDLDLDSINSKIGLDLNLAGADFRQLGLTGENSRAKLQLKADFEGNPEAFDLTAHLNDGNIFFKDRNYQTGTLDLAAHLRPDTTSVDIASKLVNGYLRSNTSPAELQLALSDLFTHYLDSAAERTSHRDSLEMRVDLRISADPILTDVLIADLEDFDSARVQVDFIQAKDSLAASVDFPYVIYGGTEIDSLRVRINADKDDLRLGVGFLGLNTGPVAMQKTYLAGVLENSALKMNFRTFYEDEILAQIPFEIGLAGDSVLIHISEEDLILNSTPWDIPSSNSVTYSTGNLQFVDFELSNQSQSLLIENDIEGFTEKNIATEFKNFRLENLTTILNATDTLAAGALEGQLVVENPFGATGIMGKLNIDSLSVMNTPLGKLSLEATAKSLGNYILALTLKDEGVDLGLDGTFVADETGANFEVNLDLKQIAMEKVASLSQGQLTDGQGFLSGKVVASGTTVEPIYEGEFRFNEASFVPTQLSTKYTLSNEIIRLDNDGVYFDQFVIRDADNNTFAIDGTVLTESFINPSFDLQIEAKNFMAINSTNEENDLVYGKATLDADITVQGDLTLPLVKANLRIRDNTDLTVIIPESELDLVEREGVVAFVNKNDPDDILTQPLEESTGAFSGYDIQASLAVDPKANFKIVIDPYTGDNLTISGDSELRLDINPNGRITLSGAYLVNDGFYEMSLYNLISKKFSINPDSRINWNGDPMDATLDIRAIYEVETSASDLMSSQISGADNQVKSQYQQRLKFLVYLNVKGELLKPEITFALDMPVDERGAFGGNVYSRVLQLNSEEDELNKQVFSLLVLDRFFPSQGSDGSSGGAEAMARNSASRLLTDQMNALSNKLFGDSGFSLGVDVDSYQDYQSGSAQNRTDLNINAQQTLFDDRLVIKVGSQMELEGASQSKEEANTLLANISFEYLLTEDGRWRIRAFRQNQFESIIDGQLFVTGLGLNFNRDFNEFKELWKAPVPVEDEKKETRKEKRAKKKAAKANEKSNK